MLGEIGVFEPRLLVFILLFVLILLLFTFMFFGRIMAGLTAFVVTTM
jgi:hypothetical protein